MMKTFYVGVKAVIVKDGKVLILKRINRENNLVYDLPGGRIDDDESIEEALKRELKEELDIENYTVGKLINGYRLTNYDIDGDGLILIFYEVKTDIRDVKLSKEHIDYKWVSKEELNDLIKKGESINQGIIRALEKVLK